MQGLIMTNEKPDYDELFLFDGKRFACDVSGNKSQFFIKNIYTSEISQPIMTKTHQCYSKFWNASNRNTKTSFYFTAKLVGDHLSKHLRNVKILTDEEVKTDYIEYFI